MRDSQVTLSDFVNKDRFELNSYLAYLLQQFNDEDQAQSKDKMIKQ